MSGTINESVTVRHTSTSIAEQSKAPLAPPVPPKPSAAVLHSQQPQTGLRPILAAPKTKSPMKEDTPKGVHLLAQQFGQHKTNSETKNGDFSKSSTKISDSSSSNPTPGHTKSSRSTPPTDGNHVQEQFVDEEMISGTSGSESESDTNSISSGDSDIDDNLIRQVQEAHIRYTTSDHRRTLSGGTAVRPPPPPAGSNSTAPKVKHPPPPPPPSRKYHSAARVSPVAPDTRTPVAVSVPKQTSTIDSSSGSTSVPSPPCLPPRPTTYAVQHPDIPLLPQLPPRPSASTLARSHTISVTGSSTSTTPPLPRRGTHSVSPPAVPISDASPDDQPTYALKRSQTMIQKRTASPRSEALMTSSVYPEFANATRNPPLIDYNRRITTGHKGTAYAVAACGPSLATGTNTTRIWDTNSCQCLFVVDHSTPSDPGDKIRSLAFSPSRKPRDEGRYLWVGLQDGVLAVIDSANGEILGKRSTTHNSAISFILRYKNTELWTVDESGVMNVWPVLTVDCERDHPLEITPQRYKVTPKAVAALALDSDLWMSSGRTLDLFRLTQSQLPSPHVRIPNDLGNITGLVAVPHHKQRIFASHDDGKISVWDTLTVDRVQVITVSMYGICAMAAVGDYYIWAGYNTGMIYVYDTRPDKWIVVKMWKAHTGSVTDIIVDESAFARDEKTVQVISADSSGTVSIWDGLMVENWQDQQLQEHTREYCTYRDARIMICSWNIDANKPEKLLGSDDEGVHEWLGGMDEPDIIVVGIQEIVDLESKKQTARSLFASRKKTEAAQESDETLTHRYRLWHDHLIRVIGDNYGQNVYTVIKTDQLVGLFSCIFVKTSERDRIFHCESTQVKTGLKVMNKSLHGNKGGIAIRFLFDHTSLCFVNCHLAAGQSHVQQRNADAEGILQNASFKEFPEYYDIFANGGDGSLVMDHELCFLSGDLNYRINMRREKVLQLLASADKHAAWEILQKEDQLHKQRLINPLFKLLTFNEAPILFDPTYKYDPGTDFYDRSEKKRVPAWCDRVLSRGKDIQNMYYQRHEVRASDHRPISSGFVAKVKLIEDKKRDRLLEKIELDWHQHLTRLIKEKKARYVADYELCSVQEAHRKLEAVGWDVHQAVANLFY
ncbi:hypothetical protein DFQ29_002743 [Apophysomyces sp. BC1021]|nr:hypothetical protein DFQ29_002743 [Apophysomyces sp. BC1021]